MCAFLGPAVTSECILPFLDKARVDNHDIVVASAVRCVWTLIEMSLLSKPMIVDTFIKTAPLLVHPVSIIRENTIGMIAAAAKYFGIYDSYVFLLPYIRPILTCDIIGLELTEISLNQFLLPPLPRAVYQKVIRQWPQSFESIRKEYFPPKETTNDNNNNTNTTNNNTNTVNSSNSSEDEEKKEAIKKTIYTLLGSYSNILIFIY